MRLTTYTDYSLRLLMYLAVKPDGLATIPQVAKAYGISANHLMKVVHQLGQAGYVDTIRGRNGGMRLGKPAAAIGVGELVRFTEPDMEIVPCFQPDFSGLSAATSMPAEGCFGPRTAGLPVHPGRVYLGRSGLHARADAIIPRAHRDGRHSAVNATRLGATLPSPVSRAGGSMHIATEQQGDPGGSAGPVPLERFRLSKPCLAQPARSSVWLRAPTHSRTRTARRPESKPRWQVREPQIEARAARLPGVGLRRPRLWRQS